MYSLLFYLYIYILELLETNLFICIRIAWEKVQNFNTKSIHMFYCVYLKIHIILYIAVSINVTYDLHVIDKRVSVRPSIRWFAG